MSTIVEHIPGTFYVEFRQDYVMLCKSCTYRKSKKSKSSPYCKALILAITEYWTNRGRDPYVCKTYPQWSEAMYGMFGRWVIQDSLDELVEERLLIRERCKINGRDSYKYLLNVDEANRRLAEVSRLQVGTTDLQIDASDLKVGATQNNSSSVAPISRHLEGEKNPIKNKKEREAPPPVILSDEEQFIHNLYCQLSHIAIAPEITPALKEHWNKLVPHIKTLEDMVSLYEYTKTAIEASNFTTKTVNPGNMVKPYILNGWLAERQKPKVEDWRQASTPEPEEQVEEMPEPTLEECLGHVHRMVQKNGLPEHGEPAVAEASELFDLAGVSTGRFYKAIFTAVGRVPRRVSRENWAACLLDEMARELKVTLIPVGG